MPITKAPVPRLRASLTLDEYSEAFAVLGLEPLRVFRDPIGTLRHVSACDLRIGNRFLRMVQPPDEALDLESFESEDLARLSLSVVFIHVADAMRRRMHFHRAPNVRGREDSRARSA